MHRSVPWQLHPDPDAPFPPASSALRDPDGLLAIGGDLQPHRLLNAYRHGIFPWFNPGETILWWSPDPRTVFETQYFRFSRGNRRALRPLSHCQIRIDHDFRNVMSRCANAPRAGQHGTWISQEMIEAYCRLHDLGHAHCVSIHDGDELIGGIYGVAVGRMFYGESMFSARTGGSKLALAALCRFLAAANFPLLDAQVHNPHLALLGAKPMNRQEFLEISGMLAEQPGLPFAWKQHPVPSICDLLD